MNLMKYRKLAYLFSLAILLPGVVSLILFRVNPSIDFTGGTLVEIEGSKDKGKIEEIAKNNKFEELTIIETDSGFSLRSKVLSEENHKTFKEELAKI